MPFLIVAVEMFQLRIRNTDADSLTLRVHSVGQISASNGILKVTGSSRPKCWRRLLVGRNRPDNDYENVQDFGREITRIAVSAFKLGSSSAAIKVSVAESK